MKMERINEIVDKYDSQASFLIQIMLDIQNENRWLPRAALEIVGERLGVPLSRMLHIATFYKAFSLSPKGRHQINVCMGTACHIRGAGRVLDTISDLTKIGPGETDLDLKFSLETVNCLGCCALGPVVEIDGQVHGKISAANTAKVLDGYE